MFNFVDKGADLDILKSINTPQSEEELVKAMDKSKLVQKEIVVQTKHGMVRRKQWVKATETDDAHKVPQGAISGKQMKEYKRVLAIYRLDETASEDEIKEAIQTAQTEFQNFNNASIKYAKKFGLNNQRAKENLDEALECKKDKETLEEFLKLKQNGKLDSNKPASNKSSDGITEDGLNKAPVGSKVTYQDASGDTHTATKLDSGKFMENGHTLSAKTLQGILSDNAGHGKQQLISAKTDTTAPKVDNSQNNDEFKPGQKVKSDQLKGTWEVATDKPSSPNKVVVKNSKGVVNEVPKDSLSIIDDKPDKSTTSASSTDPKSKMQELTKGMSPKETIKFAKDNGITWKENDHEGINLMRAKMAITKAVKEGKFNK